MTDLLDIARQNDLIIRLLGRIAFKPEDIRRIVTAKKQNPLKYIEGYNALDGKTGVSQVAAIVGVKAGTISPILQAWEEEGIIYKVSKDQQKGVFYKRLFELEVK
jgi:hypothetical protein